MEKDILNIQPIWERIIKALNKNNIKYVIVGASAMVLHGIPRSTLDIDIYVEAKEDVLRKLFNIAKDLDLKSYQKDILKVAHLPKLFTNQWICFSYNKQDILDVFLADKIEFENLYKNSEVKKDSSLKVRVASLIDIIRMKKKVGRSMDLIDIKLIKEAIRTIKKDLNAK
ncbi:MAG: hypothetical protein DRP68_02320 [Candidatus Omnitrophota bacterium]|nr:MAG: hypothetical protein DRP68_02320 [Candidatus Omnitrophota bacterium]RKY45121.1 MAG: hypothetical protein DRP81_04730 [Candidatus Omnitrophota bacterium]